MDAAILADFILECGGENETIEFIAAWIADGESMDELVKDGGYKRRRGLNDIAATYALNWGVLAAWIRKDNRRNQRYIEAMQDRGAIRRERILDKWWEVAKKDPDGAPSFGDVHKALEALAKTESMFKENLTVTATITRSTEELSDEELLHIAAGGGKGTDTAQDSPPVAPSVH